jgi:hypothetical protein
MLTHRYELTEQKTYSRILAFQTNMISTLVSNSVLVLPHNRNN